MRSVPLVRLFWVHPFLQFFREAGAPVDRCLEEAGVPPEIDQDLEMAFPSRPLYEVIDRLVRDSGSSDLGLKIGRWARIWSLGPFGRQIAGQANLGEVIATAQELMSSVHTGRRLSLTTSGSMAHLASRLDPDQLAPTLWDDHFTLKLMMDLVRSTAGQDWLPERATVQTRCRRGWRCGTEATTIEFPRRLLTCRLQAGSKRALHSVPVFRRDIDLEVLPNDLTSSLRTTLNSLVVLGQGNLESLARVVGSSPRTVHRRLRDRGRGFRELLAESRLTLARRRLRDPSAKVVDIAFELGYSDSSHFIRAFGKWTGQTPVGYRRARAAEMVQAGAMQ